MRSASPKRSPNSAARARGVVRFAQLARAQMSLADRQQQVALLDAVPPFALDQALRATQPSARASGFAAREQAKPQPERGARRGQALARLETCVIQALLRRQHLLVPRGQPRRPGQTMQILGPERRRLIRGRKRLESIVPFVPLEAGAPSLERSRNLGLATFEIAIGGLVRWHRYQGTCCDVRIRAGGETKKIQQLMCLVPQVEVEG